MNTLHSRDSINGLPRSSTSRLAVLDNGMHITTNNDLPDQIDFGSRLTLPSHRLRSESPQKSPKETGG
jgi:hypothetical protein